MWFLACMVAQNASQVSSETFAQYVVQAWSPLSLEMHGIILRDDGRLSFQSPDS
jgi:hypothetical protein